MIMMGLTAMLSSFSSSSCRILNSLSSCIVGDLDPNIFFSGSLLAVGHKDTLFTTAYHTKTLSVFLAFFPSALFHCKFI